MQNEEEKFLPLAEYLKARGSEYIERVLLECKGSNEKAAKLLKISVATLYRWRPAKKRKPRRSITLGCVYLMKNERCGLYKIGYTNGAAEFRERTLQAEDPKVSLVAKWDGTTRDESRLHRLFAEKRERGEWFSLNQSDIERMADYFSC